jgi:hypothetical protein
VARGESAEIVAHTVMRGAGVCPQKILPDEIAVAHRLGREVLQQRRRQWVPGQHVVLGVNDDSSCIRHPSQQIDNAGRYVAARSGRRPDRLAGQLEKVRAFVVGQSQCPVQGAEHST